ncbi:hypothetical protein [Bdellovibrio bacteriovorus]|uniref:hypothetical protein n=1 Tax=Bdellovibrio bacteriovorus TaxID=959 RepID=UPI000B2B6F72|nr:hypothetical protein [Bdellovibrio bacteriovorus]
MPKSLGCETHPIQNSQGYFGGNLSTKYPEVKIINCIAELIENRAKGFEQQGLSI